MSIWSVKTAKRVEAIEITDFAQGSIQGLPTVGFAKAFIMFSGFIISMWAQADLFPLCTVIGLDLG